MTVAALCQCIQVVGVEHCVGSYCTSKAAPPGHRLTNSHGQPAASPWDESMMGGLLGGHQTHGMWSLCFLVCFFLCSLALWNLRVVGDGTPTCVFPSHAYRSSPLALLLRYQLWWLKRSRPLNPRPRLE